jgi:hypothetical protein
MALKKALVITAGQIEQLQPGDSIQEVDAINLTNGEAAPIVIGTAVYMFAAGSVKKARANAVGTTPVIGLVAQTTITNAVAGAIQVDGILAASTAQWDAVAGTTGGLTFGVRYYLSEATAGLLTATAPSTGFVQEVGIALSSTELLIRPGAVIKL